MTLIQRLCKEVLVDTGGQLFNNVSHVRRLHQCDGTICDRMEQPAIPTAAAPHSSTRHRGGWG